MPTSLLYPILCALALSASAQDTEAPRRPNFVVVFCDDLGWGDLACFGHPTIRTPQLDRMAHEGLRLTQFYAAAPVCTPSRAGLLTGRLPIRSGMCSSRRRVLFPDSKGGLPASEVTVAEALVAAGYATGCFGKWHLGHLPPYLPLQHGFQRYWGIPYSNDMDRVKDAPRGRKAFLAPRSEYWNAPILEGNDVIERPARQETITRRYTDHAIDFIRKNKKQPFFVYLPHSMPHVPLFASEAHRGKSPRGLFGDVIEEIDANVGRLLQALRDEDLDEHTLVLFTSDNGPWLAYGAQGGCAGPLKNGKGTTFEGGVRVPTLAWWPGRVPAGKTSAGVGSTLDVLPTLLALAGVELPPDRVLDGVDMSPVLFDQGTSRRKTFFYYRGDQLWAARLGRHKAHFITQGCYGVGPKRKVHDPPLLHDLLADPGERYDVASQHPDVIQAIARVVEEHRASLEPVASQLELR